MTIRRSWQETRFEVTKRGHNGHATEGYTGGLPVLVWVYSRARAKPCHICGKRAWIVTEESRRALCPQVGKDSGVIVCETLGRLLETV